MGLLLFVKEDGLNPKRVASTNGGEYHSPCPGCGGKDRFIIWDKLNRYFCRQCRRRGDEVQYYRDFHGLSYKDACRRLGILPKERAPILTKRSYDDQEYTNDPQFEPRQAKTPSAEWRQQAASFILYCQEQLKNNSFALKSLLNRGFSRETIEKFHLGFNPDALWLNRGLWGLEVEERKLWIPRGIVIPSYRLATEEPVKLKIRRSDWLEGDYLPKYVEVSGSMQTFSVYEKAEDKPIVVVESELDAILLQQHANDLCCAMALGGASKRPDDVSHALLVRVRAILFSLDVDAAGAKAYRWWKAIYPQMKLWPPPIGKSPGDALLAGIDLRKWICLAL